MKLPKKKLYTLIALAAVSLGILIAAISIFSLSSSFQLGVKDSTAPTITLTGESHMVLPLGSTYTEPGFTATDDIDGDLTASVTVEGSINTQIYGKQFITYTVTDASGNVGKAQRLVVVQEFVPPELALSGTNKLYIPTGEAFAEPGYSATDNVDGDITSLVTTSGFVDVTTAGCYTLTYTAIDSSKNVTTLTRTVYVFEPQSDEQAANPPGKVVYLTFDDGPGQYTQQLLDILDKYNVNVTFFVTNQYPDYQNLIGEAHRRGHSIGMHTYSHVFQNIYASETAYYNDLNSIRAICEAQTGETPKIIRFPGGTSNSTSKKYCKGIMTALTKSVTANGYLYCDWNVDSNDAGGATTSSEVAANVIRDIQAKNRSVVLQHDTKQYSVEAVEEIIYWGLSNGYTFLPLTEDSQMVHHRANN